MDVVLTSARGFWAEGCQERHTYTGYKYKLNAMIPKKIHYIWFGNHPKSALTERCIQSWQCHLPEYEIILWNEDNLPREAALSWKLLEKKQYAFASDYARYYVLSQHGGIYLDVDVEVVRSFDPLLDNRCFLGYEAKNRLNSAVVGAEPDNSFVSCCMKLMEERFSQSKPFLIAPELANEGLKHSQEVTCYPETYFYPYNPYDDVRQVKQLMVADITGSTYAVHHWEKNWKMGLLSKLRRVLVSK